MNHEGKTTLEICQSKVRYEDRLSAMISAAQLEFQNRSVDLRGNRPKEILHGQFPQEPYLCPVCKGWHLTSKIKGLKR